MSAAQDPAPPGRGVRWRRRLGYVPLVLLVVCSIAALGGGIRTASVQNAHTVPTAAPSADAAGSVASVCRPAVEPAAQEPWLKGDGSAETTWQEHSAEVGKPYIVGPDGWTFWSDYIEDYASQAVGRATLSDAQVQNWVDYYTSLRDGLKAEGIDFQIIVTPSTSSVYPEELPEWMQKLRGSTILDQFMARSGDLPVIDMRQPLIDAKTPDVHLFSWSNSHWTDWGGYVGWKQIAACMNAENPNGPQMQVPSTSGWKITGDFNEWASYDQPSPGEDWAAPVFDGPLADVTYTDKDGATKTVPGSTPMDASWLPLSTVNADSWTGQSALIVRDSMGGAISPYWDQAYASTQQIYHQWTGYQDWPQYRQLVSEYHPDVVILQLAERHLVNPPPAGAGY